MNNIKLILTTHDDLIQARELARYLVEQRAAACVNIIPQLESVFHWENEVQTENEILLLIKTTETKVEQVKAILEERHSYDVPEIIAFNGEVLHQPYMDWVRECLGEL
ncbi:MAG: divalent-cation tolerance protein CutA [Candidatus Marinimicrobia bacterium]|nr:divalent-cation tolerance protein CutA [Candidatus Neomarinimicrobiota bacterium]